MTNRLAATTVETAIGRFRLVASPAGLTHCQLERSQRLPDVRAACEDDAARRHLEASEAAFREYFAGERKEMDDLAFAPEGSSFQRRVWNALLDIPFGQTESYGHLAERIGAPGAARAIGRANNQNPIGILVPCHRVIGADGSLVGYGAELWRKEWLLAHEGAIALSLFS